MELALQILLPVPQEVQRGVQRTDFVGLLLDRRQRLGHIAAREMVGEFRHPPDRFDHILQQPQAPQHHGSEHSQQADQGHQRQRIAEPQLRNAENSAEEPDRLTAAENKQRNHGKRGKKSRDTKKGDDFFSDIHILPWFQFPRVFFTA